VTAVEAMSAISMFADRNRFASWTGTAPVDASCGEQIHHRLPRAGNRKMNHVLHIAVESVASTVIVDARDHRRDRG
jgi:transposase